MLLDSHYSDYLFDFVKVNIEYFCISSLTCCAYKCLICFNGCTIPSHNDQHEIM